jgi:aromatic-L-amino-acid decarboxylase
MGRRFRALKLWFAIRCDGVASFQEMIRRHVGLTQELAAVVRADGRFEIVAPHPLNLLCVAVRGDDHDRGNLATDRLVEKANETGRALFTRTVLDGRSVLRFSVGGSRTDRQHVMRSWSLLSELVDDII